MLKIYSALYSMMTISREIVQTTIRALLIAYNKSLFLFLLKHHSCRKIRQFIFETNINIDRLI
jgi:hypothetical protein